jgi:hypothetical protein
MLGHSRVGWEGENELAFRDGERGVEEAGVVRDGRAAGLWDDPQASVGAAIGWLGAAW